MLITDILTENARIYGVKTALIEREPARNSRREITWTQFDLQANRLANSLISLGVKKGDKVIQLMSNCLEWLPIYFGILRTGAWAVPLNFRFEADKIELCSNVSEAMVFVFGEEFIDRVNTAKRVLDKNISTYIFVGPREKCPDYAIHYEKTTSDSSPENPGVALSPDDDAALYFTSGTTGTPKAVRLTHGNLESSCIVENEHHGQTHDDNFLCIPPLYHTGAKMHWFGSFLKGSKCVLLKGVKPKWILEAVSEEQVTIVWLLVPWAYDILNEIQSKNLDLNSYCLKQWRLMHIGAQPVPPTLIEQWLKIFPNQEYDTNYGLTESTGPGCVHLGIGNLDNVGAIGLAGHGWECKIIDGDGKILPGGESGELLIKGPGVMKEYYKNPEATRQTIIDGWLHTGDVARKDRSDFIWLVDRKKDVIITGGENIYPVEIEHFYMQNEKLLDIGVIGIPDERLGEITAAIVTPKNGYEVTIEELHKFAEGLPRYKRPRKIFFDEVPRNPTGKIEKPKLRRKYANPERPIG